MALFLKKICQRKAFSIMLLKTCYVKSLNKMWKSYFTNGLCQMHATIHMYTNVCVRPTHAVNSAVTPQNFKGLQLI